MESFDKRFHIKLSEWKKSSANEMWGFHDEGQ